jgi:hypothetical protein
MAGALTSEQVLGLLEFEGFQGFVERGFVGLLGEFGQGDGDGSGRGFFVEGGARSSSRAKSSRGGRWGVSTGRGFDARVRR